MEEIAETVGEPIDVFQIKIKTIGIATGNNPSFRRFTRQVQKPAFADAQDAVASMITVHRKTKAAIEVGAHVDVVAWDNCDEAVTGLL